MMDNIGMDARESNEDMNKGRDRWLVEVDRSCRLKVMASMRSKWHDEEFRKARYSEAMEVLFQKHLRGQSPSGMGRILGFLITTAKYCCLSAHRKESRLRARVSFDGTTESIFAGLTSVEHDRFCEDEFQRERVIVREQLFEALEYGLACLGEKQVHLIRAFYMENKSMSEIAELYGYACAKSAKVAVCKARKQLRDRAYTAFAA